MFRNPLRSEANESDHPRWSLICCYNAARNDPYLASHHPRYRPLEKLADKEIAEVGRSQWSALAPA